MLNKADGVAPFIIQNRRTGMYVAKAVPPKSAHYRMPSAHWKWVWKREDAEQFGDRMLLIHPIIQMNIEQNAVCLDANGAERVPC